MVKIRIDLLAVSIAVFSGVLAGSASAAKPNPFGAVQQTPGTYAIHANGTAAWVVNTTTGQVKFCERPTQGDKPACSEFSDPD
jgi:hypothetical protein